MLIALPAGWEGRPLPFPPSTPSPPPAQTQEEGTGDESVGVNNYPGRIAVTPPRGAQRGPLLAN